MKFTFAILVSFAFVLPLFAEYPPSPYQVTWDTPSENVNGTMPLGNGEVALNAWVDASGDLRFYIARIDSIDENARILKLGALRFRVGSGESKRTTDAFRQILDVKRGLMETEFGKGSEKVVLRLWVDANRPVIVVEAETAKPCDVVAHAENWRTKREKLPSIETGDLNNKSNFETFVEPDTVLSLPGQEISWYHRNQYSDSYQRVAELQGMDDFSRENPILHRTFGVLARCSRPEKIDDLTLRSTSGTTHRFEIVALTKHPATESQWLADATKILNEAQKIPITKRLEDHNLWWSDFWQRSWIHITPGQEYVARVKPLFPENGFSLLLGKDQNGGSEFQGEMGRFAAYKKVLTPQEIAKLSQTKPEAIIEQEAVVFAITPKSPAALEDSSGWTFSGGATFEAWIKPKTVSSFMRLFDKISPGKSDGFLFDLTPQGGLRLIQGDAIHTVSAAVKTDQWQHVAVAILPYGTATFYYNGRPVSYVDLDATVSDPFVLTRAYALQRYVSACAGRGRYPIKFNGSLFTVPHKDAPGNADYRRWGTGYWFQNTRLPYISMPTAGDFEMMQPFFRMYFDLLPLCKYRTEKYFGYAGAYYPECIYFWGDVFPESYGWETPWNERDDKLQSSRWHKWEWVGGLEIANLMLEYYEYTEDERFLNEKAIPFSYEILKFFEEYYPLDDHGKLLMHPSQALETWWECTNPMPEIAGMYAVIDRLQKLPDSSMDQKMQTFLTDLRTKLPPIPLTKSPDGKTMLAPAEKFANKLNIENPELYAVYPFRLFDYEKPNSEWAIEALKHRLDRGPFGWRQEDIFMAYLGLTDEARDYLVKRARSKHAESRFPVFWGPNYDWVPDQDHGGVLNKGVQSLIMQCDGNRIDLFPAWPADWNCHFKLHAPQQTTVEGRLENGKVIELTVTPEARKKDVRIFLFPSEAETVKQ